MPKISSDSISTNSYDMKIVYHYWDRAVKRSGDIFGSVLRDKRHELDSCITDYPVWLPWRLFDPHLRAAFRAGQGINLPDLLDKGCFYNFFTIVLPGPENSAFSLAYNKPEIGQVLLVY